MYIRLKPQDGTSLPNVLYNQLIMFWGSRESIKYHQNQLACWACGKVQKVFVADIGTSQKSHSNTFELALQTCLPTSERQMAMFLFQGIPLLHNFFFTFSKRREAMTAQKTFGRSKKNGKHTAISHHQPCQLHG